MERKARTEPQPLDAFEPSPACAAVRLDREGRRRQILDVARDIFLKEGYAACSMAAIAQRLGGSKGTLYNYFSSKEQLFAALIRAEGEQEAESWRAPDADGPVEARLSAIGSSILRIVTAPRCQALHRLVIAESGRFPELGRIFYESGPATRIAVLADFLAEETRSGRLRVAEPERAAREFLALCKAGVNQKLLWNVGPAPTAADLSADVAAAVRMFLAAYGPR